MSPEDLVDPNNRECCICLEDNKLDEKVVRLPCAHIFHASCIVDWLSNHSCTCPVCRYELPTDNPAYEAGRKERMKSRKPRYAMHELKRMRVSDLLALHRRPMASGFFEKKDLIQSLIDADWIDVIPSPKPVEYELGVLKGMKIRELKRTMEEAGVFFRREDVIEKSDMISVFENSGRLVLIKADSEPEYISIVIDDKRRLVDVGVGDTADTPDQNSIGNDATTTTENKSDGTIVETVRDDDDSFNNLEEDDGANANETRDQKRNASPPIVMFPNIDQEVDQESQGSNNNIEELVVDAEGCEPNLAASFEFVEEGTTFRDPDREAEEENQGSNVELVDTEGNGPDLAGAYEIVDRGNTISRVPDDEVEEESQGSNDIGFEPEGINPNLTAAATFDSVDRGTILRDPDEEVEEESQGSNVELETEIEGIEENLAAAFDLVDQGENLSSTFDHYTLRDLKTLARDLQVDLSGCIERGEMIDMFVSGGITGTPDASALSPLMFSSWNISQLRVVGSEINTDLSRCATADEMIEQILHVGNVERPYLRDYLRFLSPLTTKSISDLLAIARELQIYISDCLEKDDIIRRVITRAQQRIEVN